MTDLAKFALLVAISTICAAQRKPVQKTEILTGPPGGRKVIKINDITSEKDYKWSKQWEMCPSGTKATGFVLKTDPYRGVGFNADDSSINGISLLCGDNDDIRATSEVGKYGEWGQMVKCRKNNYLASFKMAFDVPIEGKFYPDLIGLDDIIFTCSASSANFRDYDIVPVAEEKSRRKAMRGVYRQSWTKWSEKCDNGICGINTNVDVQYKSNTDSFNADRTGVNDVRFVCC